MSLIFDLTRSKIIPKKGAGLTGFVIITFDTNFAQSTLIKITMKWESNY